MELVLKPKDSITTYYMGEDSGKCGSTCYSCDEVECFVDGKQIELPVKYIQPYYIAKELVGDYGLLYGYLDSSFDVDEDFELKFEIDSIDDVKLLIFEDSRSKDFEDFGNEIIFGIVLVGNEYEYADNYDDLENYLWC